MKKILSMALIMALTLCTLVGCGNSATTSTNSGSSQSSDSVSADNSLASQFVGRWECGYLNNSDDASFEEYDEITVWKEDPDSELTTSARYIEFFSNGTGSTDYYADSYYNNKGVVFEWEVVYDDYYEQDVLKIYYALEEDECDEFGFLSNCKTIKDTEFKDAQIVAANYGGNTQPEEYKEPVKTVSFRFFESHVPFVKVSDNFTDNTDLGCENAFKSIDLYRADPDAYEEKFGED